MNTVTTRKAPVADADEQISTARLIHRVRQDLAGDWGRLHHDDEFHPMNLISTAEQIAPKKILFGMPIFDLSWVSGLSLIAQYAATPGAHAQVSFLNANNINIMLKDAAYRDVLKGHIVLPDGIGMDLAASIIDGEPFAANLNGTDFVPALLPIWKSRVASV
ncbi:hypothetical protein [Agrobacterium vitis]|uniref:hypothetical protein n=1 Tax=Agrobacterium vitis TaxID=373 RepID=UPI003D2A0397